jgi:hypothetical protein
VSAIPEGLALCNPGNIERLGDAFHYDGEIVPSRHPKLREFRSMTWGLRAILEDLLTYIVRDNIRKLGDAVARWAPPSENDTPAYTAAVCGACHATDQTAFTVAFVRANAQALLDVITQREVGVVFATALTGAAVDLVTWPQEHE